MITQVLKEAREKKGDLAVLWLDLANAYGSMPYKLVLETLERHHVPAVVRMQRSQIHVWDPPTRAFMDDLTVTTELVPGPRWILMGLERLIGWARMSFKASKFLGLEERQSGRKVPFLHCRNTNPDYLREAYKELGKVI